MAWELNGNPDATAASFLGPTNAQPLVIRTGTTPSPTPPERLRVTTEGRVGIGIANPQAKLSVAGGGAIINNVSVGNNGLDDLDYPNEADTIGLARPGTSALLRLQSPNGLTFHTGTPGTTAADNLRMTITPSGEVGIGKAPAANYKLEVAGILNATDYHKNGSALVSSQWTDVSGGGISYAAGNVGISTTSPQWPLQVGGDVGGLGFAPSDASPNAGYVRWGDNTGWKLHFGRSRESSGGALNTGTDGVLVTLQDNGHVGIGTTAPENAEGWNKVLDILGGGSTKLSIRTNNIDARVLAHNTGWWGAPAGMIIGTNSNHPVSLGTNRASRVTITNTGQVGIGTSAPQMTLHVVGNRIRLAAADRRTLDMRADGSALDISSNGGDLFINNGGPPVRIPNLVQPSSRELKENIVNFTTQEAMTALDGLKPSFFNWKNEEEKTRRLGFVAEDTPEIATTRDKTAVVPMHILAILSKVVQEQQRMIGSMRRDLNLRDEVDSDVGLT
jgi:hypothetical protein